MEKKNIIILIGVIIFSTIVLNSSYDSSKKVEVKTEPTSVTSEVLKQKYQGTKSFLTNVKNDPYLKQKVDNAKQTVKGFFSKLKREAKGMKEVRQKRKEMERIHNVKR